MSAAKPLVGVDVGGTFTDLFLFDAAARSFRTAKVPSERGNESAGFMQGLDALGKIADFGSIVHGTTVGTNTLLERRGPAHRRHHHARLPRRAGDAPARPPQDLGPVGRVPADRRPRSAPRGRRAHAGRRHASAPRSTQRRCARRREALRAKGAEALAIIFINAYANAENERRALEAARAVWPNEHVSASHQVLPEIREFERASTTALNAYLQPVVGAYLAKLEGALAQNSFDGTFHIVQSNGGVMSTATARRLPVRTALSGPAAGVIAAAAIARATGYDNVITCDLGGTSFDVSVVAGAKASLAAQSVIDFGLVIRTPMIEITTIGAGGGSIASVDRGGLLQVGPGKRRLRAGARLLRPGQRPPDADRRPCRARPHQRRAADRRQARRARRRCRQARDRLTHVGEPLQARPDAGGRGDRARRRRAHGRRHPPGLDRARPRSGQVRRHAVRRRRRAACLRHDQGDRARNARWCRAFPASPRRSAASSPTCATTRCRPSISWSTGSTPRALDARMVAAGKEAKAVVEAAGIAVERIDVQFELDMHYLGQTHTVAVPLPVTLAAGGTGISEQIVRAAFDKAYAAAFGRLLPGIPAAHRLAAHRGHRPPPAFRPVGFRAGAGCVARKGRERVRARSGSTAPGTRRKYGRGSICRRAR